MEHMRGRMTCRGGATLHALVSNTASAQARHQQSHLSFASFFPRPGFVEFADFNGLLWLWGISRILLVVKRLSNDFSSKRVNHLPVHFQNFVLVLNVIVRIVVHRFELICVFQLWVHLLTHLFYFAVFLRIEVRTLICEKVWFQFFLIFESRFRFQNAS